MNMVFIIPSVAWNVPLVYSTYNDHHSSSTPPLYQGLTVDTLEQQASSGCCPLCWTVLNCFMGSLVRTALDFCPHSPPIQEGIKYIKAKEQLRFYCPNIYCAGADFFWTCLVCLKKDRAIFFSLFVRIFFGAPFTVTAQKLERQRRLWSLTIALYQTGNIRISSLKKGVWIMYLIGRWLL